MAVNLCDVHHPLISFAKNRIQGKKHQIAHLLLSILTLMERPLMVQWPYCTAESTTGKEASVLCRLTNTSLAYNIKTSDYSTCLEDQNSEEQKNGLISHSWNIVT